MARKWHDNYVHLLLAAGLTPKLQVSIGVTWRNTIDGIRTVGEELDEVGIEWATTGIVADALTAPLLTNVSSAVVYVEANTMAALNSTLPRRASVSKCAIQQAQRQRAPQPGAFAAVERRGDRLGGVQRRRLVDKSMTHHRRLRGTLGLESCDP